MKNVAIAFKLAEILQFAGDDMLRQAAKISEDLQLQFLGHAGQFSGAGGRKNDLKRAHRFAVNLIPPLSIRNPD